LGGLEVERGRRRVTAAAVIALLVIACLIACYLAIPRNRFYIFPSANGGTVTVSREGIQFEPPPDRYTSGAFNHIEPYISRLVVPSRRKRWVSLFTPAGDRGFALHATSGVVEAHLTVEWRQEPQREAAIRAFFASLGIPPTEDYLAGNGGVPDATRPLAYPLPGDSSEMADLARRILRELCSVSPDEPLNIGER
jgi:hypothetical protein